jgi:hypothetical protein
MNSYDFSQVDFVNGEVRRSLARAYAVVLRIAKPPSEDAGRETAEQGTEHTADQNGKDTEAEQVSRYVQERMF